MWLSGTPHELNGDAAVSSCNLRITARASRPRGRPHAQPPAKTIGRVLKPPRTSHPGRFRPLETPPDCTTRLRTGR